MPVARRKTRRTVEPAKLSDHDRRVVEEFRETLTKPHAKPQPDAIPKGKRHDPIGSFELQQRMKDGGPPVAALKPRLIDWHGALAQVSGTLTLAVSRGLGEISARAVVEQLRLIADDMEKRLQG